MHQAAIKAATFLPNQADELIMVAIAPANRSFITLMYYCNNAIADLRRKSLFCRYTNLPIGWIGSSLTEGTPIIFIPN
jgi:hypothetical protein